MSDFLQTLFHPGDAFEVRVLSATSVGWRTPHTVAGYFDYDHVADARVCIDALASYAGAYVTINPVNPALLSRAYNRLGAAQRDATTSDGDILCRRWLFVDVDPVRPAGISATDDEKSAARETAECLRDSLESVSWPEPVMVDSGNGFYLLYRINLPADDGGLVSRVLKAMSASMSTETVHIDTSVSNAARIARIPGTWNRKGDHRPERPHRLATVLHVPDTLTPVPVELLEAIAGTAPTPAPKPMRTAPINPDNARPGDLYAQTADVPELLLSHGWQMVGGPSNNQQWRRPGKTDGNHSATWNGEVFYVFSSSAPPFEPNTGYGAFGVYAALEHGGDHSAAAKALHALGFHSPEATYPSYPGVDLGPFLASIGASGTVEVVEEEEELEEEQPVEDFRPDVFPERLLYPPGLMGEVIRYNLDTAHKPQPVLALAGALCLQAALCARKVKTANGTRPNLYIIAVASSGAGKNHARSINRRILTESGNGKIHAESMVSGAAILTALADSKTMLFQLDELGIFMRGIKNPEKNPHGHDIIRKMLDLYSNSGCLYETSRYADKEKTTTIQDPHLILYGTTVAESLYDGLSVESVTNGFLARVMIFDSAGAHPRRRILVERSLPESILHTAKWWASFHPGGGNLDVEPIVVPVMLDAFQHMANFIDIETEEQEKIKDSPLSTLWTRTAENADKLALLYACSANPESPIVNLKAVEWAYAVAEYLTRRMISIVGDNISSSQFHGDVLRVQKIIRDCGGRISRTDLIRKSKHKKRELDEIMEYLKDSEKIITEPGKKGGVSYRLVRG